MKLNNVGLVLEGGGMRGAYTSGVLDFFMGKDIKFPYVIGVSAGANNGANYISEQRLRNKKVFIEMVKDDRYLGLKNLIKDGNYFGMDFLFKELPNEILPFDYKTFKDSSTKFKVAVTNCETGKAEYFDSDNYDPNYFGEKILRASSSIPLISTPVEIEGSYYYDGGIADPIPLKKAMEDGYENNVLILTKNKGFRLKYRRSSVFLKLLLKDYPDLVEKLRIRYKIYNECLDLIEKLENKGKVYVFRPKNKLKVSSLESNQKDIFDLYNLGYHETENRYDSFKKWIESISK